MTEPNGTTGMTDMTNMTNVTDAIARLAGLPAEDRGRVLARLRAEQLSASAERDDHPIAGEARTGPAPASFAQQQLWFLDQLAPGVAAYNVPFGFRVDGPLDPDLLATALAAVAERHEVLRSTLRTVGQRLVQVVAPHVDRTLPLVDLSAEPEPEAAAMRWARELARQPFSLSTGPLYRTRLLRLDRDGHAHILLWVASHAIADGWSVGVLLRELAAHYHALRSGEPHRLPELPVRFADYAVWQRRLVARHAERLLAHWRERLDGCSALRLPTDRARQRIQAFDGATHTFRVPRETRRRLVELSRRAGASPFTAFLAGYAVLLGGQAEQHDFAIGVPVAGRSCQELEQLMGSFINTVPLRVDLSGDPTFRELVCRVRDIALDAFAHQELPFGKLVEGLRPARDPGTNPICQTVLSFGSVPLADREMRLAPDVTARLFGISNGTVRFETELALEDAGDELDGRFDYRTDLFEPETATRLCERYRSILETVAADPDRRLSSLFQTVHSRRSKPSGGDRQGADQQGAGRQGAAGPVGAGSATPTTPTETAIAKVWAEALCVDLVGVNDDFFALGGHSLLAAELVSQLRETFHVDLELREFFLAGTVRELAEVIDRLPNQSAAGDAVALELLERVERMSDEEVASALAALRDEPGTSRPGGAGQ